jgi:uncharacterized protein (DUF58 family)
VPAPSRAARDAAERYELALLDTPRRSRAGERLGRGTGSSLEFQDRRAYAAGDDVRHLDWRAYARTDALLVRQYREEILPRVELLIDASRSMASDDAKAQRTVDLAYVLARAARQVGCQVAAVRLGDRAEPVSFEELELAGLTLDGARPLPDVLDEARGLLRPGAARVLLSDLLAAADARSVLAPCAARAGRLEVIQVLSAFDAEPAVGAALRLVDSETDEALDLWLDRDTVAAYRARLRTLIEAYGDEARRGGGACFTLRADSDLDADCKAELCARGVLRPRATG